MFLYFSNEFFQILMICIVLVPLISSGLQKRVDSATILFLGATKKITVGDRRFIYG